MAVALALLVSYVEACIPFSIGISGIKLGLTNIVIVLLLYLSDWKMAAGVSVVRIVLAGFLFGSLVGIWYSLAGGALSLLCMVVLKKTRRFSIRGVSICGGVAHNLGQLLTAVFVVENTKLFYYFPVLCVAGVSAGYIIGILSEEMVKRIDRNLIGIKKRKRQDE